MKSSSLFIKAFLMILILTGCDQEMDDPETSDRGNEVHDTVLAITDTATMQPFDGDSLRLDPSTAPPTPENTVIKHHSPDQHIIDSIKAHGSSIKR